MLFVYQLNWFLQADTRGDAFGGDWLCRCAVIYCRKSAARHPVFK